MNRIVAAIEKLGLKLETRLDSADDVQAERELQEKINRDMDMNMEEWICCQERKSLAVAEGTLTVDEGMTIYRILGTGPASFNGAQLAQKVIVTQVLQELLSRALGRSA